MIIVKKDLDKNLEPIIVEEKYLNYLKLTENIAFKLCLGYEVIIEIFDRFGNGQMLFKKNDCCEAVVEFKEINTFDTVAIEYNNLGTIKRLYE